MCTYMCIYIYIYISGPVLRVRKLRTRNPGASVADGIGTPRPKPQTLVNRMYLLNVTIVYLIESNLVNVTIV